jgi:uncharacterized membrane protein YjjB (DUF3815 family)
MTSFELLQDIFWSGTAALGFAVLFNTPSRLLVGCFLCGAVGHGVRALLVSLGASVEFATLIGAASVGFLSVSLAARYRVPASVFAVTGAIPLVPGVFAYKTIVSLLNVTSVAADHRLDLLIAAAMNGIQTTFVLSALAFGIAAPTLLFRHSNFSVKEDV